ncbi:MAG: preprotein translocase subunit SecA [Candidatus Latescibacterota bacterium]|jgi:preprotein translocase subunit SecA
MSPLSITEDYRRTDIKTPEPIFSGLDALAYGLAGKYRRRAAVLKEFLASAEEIDGKAPLWKDKSDRALRENLAEFKEVFRRNKPGCEAQLLDALAAIREAADRRLGLRPYVVQLAGALALYQGTVVEMATGEGKTLTAGLAAVIWGWIGRPCHVITVNDYLAERDAKWLEPLYQFCAVSVGSVTSEMEPHARREGYHNDVAYTTSKEILADFLRDRLRLDILQDANRRQIRALSRSPQDTERELVMRGIHSAVVDEVDSILIDEAVTPLIISREMPNEPFVEACREANKIAATLEAGVDYSIDSQFKDVELLAGREDDLMQRAGHMPRLYSGRSQHRELVQQSLKARAFYQRDAQYVIQDGKVVIVDEFTGRLMPQRTWGTGLHQLIEAKEDIHITAPSETLARLSFQRFFRFFRRLSGMTGTAREAAGELWHMYGLPVVSIPSNQPSQRTVHPMRIFAEEEAKWQAIVEDVDQRHAQGQPVLVGTRSVKTSEELGVRLAERGLEHRVLNAVHHREEARIISHAGEQGSITVATNMAGRGVDIKLEDGVTRVGGLHVIATECHESGRIDRQLFGRCARQGDPGSARAFVSMEDELLRRYVPSVVRKSIEKILRLNLPTSSWTAEQLVHWAQRKPQKMAFQRRRAVLRTDTWLDDSLSFAQGEVSA